MPTLLAKDYHLIIFLTVSHYDKDDGLSFTICQQGHGVFTLLHCYPAVVESQTQPVVY